MEAGGEMAKQKLTVSVDEVVLKQLERYSREYDVSKSRLTSWALRYFLSQLQDGQLDLSRMFEYFKDTGALS